MVVALILALPLMAADVSGKWDFAVDLDVGSGSPTFVLEQQGETITGTYSGAAGQANLKGTVKGDDIEFQFEADTGGEKISVRYSSKILAADKMKGTAKYGTMGSGTWTATRLK